MYFAREGRIFATEGEPSKLFTKQLTGQSLIGYLGELRRAAKSGVGDPLLERLHVYKYRR